MGSAFIGRGFSQDSDCFFGAEIFSVVGATEGPTADFVAKGVGSTGWHVFLPRTRREGPKPLPFNLTCPPLAEDRADLGRLGFS